MTLKRKIHLDCPKCEKETAHLLFDEGPPDRLTALVYKCEKCGTLAEVMPPADFNKP